jgi:hypothetical protein
MDPYHSVTLDEVETKIRTLLDPYEEVVLDTLNEIDLATLAAISQLGNLQYALNFIPKLESIQIGSRNRGRTLFEWHRVPFSIHPLSVGIQYGHFDFASHFLLTPANVNVLETAIFWAILRAPQFLPRLFDRFLQQGDEVDILANLLKLAVVRNPTALPYFDPLINRPEFDEFTTDPQILQYVQSRRGQKRSTSPIESLAQYPRTE